MKVLYSWIKEDEEVEMQPCHITLQISQHWGSLDHLASLDLTNLVNILLQISLDFFSPEGSE